MSKRKNRSRRDDADDSAPRERRRPKKHGRSRDGSEKPVRNVAQPLNPDDDLDLLFLDDEFDDLYDEDESSGFDEDDDPER